MGGLQARPRGRGTSSRPYLGCGWRPGGMQGRPLVSKGLRAGTEIQDPSIVQDPISAEIRAARIQDYDRPGGRGEVEGVVQHPSVGEVPLGHLQTPAASAWRLHVKRSRTIGCGIPGRPTMQYGSRAWMPERN